MRQSTIRRLTTIAHKDFFGINNITSKDVAGAFSSGTKLSTGDIGKKYDPLMGSRVRLANEEKDEDMMFGRIRRDSDNVIRKHGQYEPEKTERLYDTIEVKQMFVPENVEAKAQGSQTDAIEHTIETSSIQGIQPVYKISEVEPVAEISEILQLFKRDDDEKMSALKYKNKPPLLFNFESASQTEPKDSHPEVFGEPIEIPTRSQPSLKPTPILKSNARKRKESKEKEKATKSVVRRPQEDLDREAGPEGARAPMHELDDLSIEYAMRQNELQRKEDRFDRSIDQKFDAKDEEQSMNAMKYIVKVRNREIEPKSKDFKQTLETNQRLSPLKPTIKLDSQGFRNYAHQVPDWTKMRRSDVIGFLRGSIVYHNYDILAINKPYGIPSHANSKAKKGEYDMDTLVAEMAQSMRIEKVFLAHRLDKTTTGILLFSTNQERARNLNKLFRSNEIKKTYWCITKDVPDPPCGVIDMPIGEIEVAGKLRSCPAPYDLEEKKQLSKKYKEARRAVTEYNVLASRRHVALVELKPQSGVKHQLRCHMAFGLNTPILGDHKYSHLTRIAPQKLAPSILQALHLRQSKARTLPLHLHAKTIVIPGAKANGETLFIDAPLPQHFSDNMKTLKLSMPQ